MAIPLESKTNQPRSLVDHVIERARKLKIAAPVLSVLVDGEVAFNKPKVDEESKEQLDVIKEKIEQGYNVIFLFNHQSHVDLPYAEKLFPKIPFAEDEHRKKIWLANRNLDPDFFKDYADNPAVNDFLAIHTAESHLPEVHTMRYYLKIHRIPMIFVAQKKDTANKKFSEEIRSIMSAINGGAIKRAVRKMKEEHTQLILCIFPEGSRSDDGKLTPAHDELTKLIQLSPENTIVVPVALVGTDDIFPKGGHRFHPKAPVTIRVGAPIEAKEFKTEKNGKSNGSISPDSVETTVFQRPIDIDDVMTQIRDMLPPEKSGYYKHRPFCPKDEFFETGKKMWETE